MGETNLDQEYERLVNDGYARGELQPRSDGPDQRQEPRFRVRNGRVVVRVEPDFNLVDISAMGLAFLSEIPFDAGTRLAIIVQGVVAFQVRVLNCPLVEVDSGLMEMRYRVQCRFDNITDGKQLLLLMKEFERGGPSNGATVS